MLTSHHCFASVDVACEPRFDLKAQDMKQISKTGDVLAKLRAAYGPDANLDTLAVWEVILANTQPLRKTGGLFKGARLASELLDEMVASVNSESVPVHKQHDGSTDPFGRVFHAFRNGDEARGLLAIDAGNHPDIAAKMDNGTYDQVSVGMMNKHLLCSKCGFDYQSPKAFEFRWAMECDKEHQIGIDGVHIVVSGLDSFFETSLVGKGAVNGARVLGPSEAASIGDQRLAASAANGEAMALHLTATVENQEGKTMDLTALTTSLTEQTSARATAEANLLSMTSARDALQTNLTAVTGERDAAITRATTAETDLAAAQTELTAAQEATAAAVTALKAEATKVLTAVGKQTELASLEDKDVAALLEVIEEHRAEFAAIIPVGGASTGADGKPTAPARPRQASAFTSRHTQR